MIEYRLILEPRGSLSVGGYGCSLASGRTTANDAAGFLIPGSTIRGALRESAARLLRGAGHGEQALWSLFGLRGSQPGKLRIGPLRVREGAPNAPETRGRLSLDRATRTVASYRPHEIEVSPLGAPIYFEGAVEVFLPLDEAEEALFRAAVAVTDQVGRGRGSGLGVVKLTLDGPVVAEDSSTPELPQGTDIVLVLEAQEPLQLHSQRAREHELPSSEEIQGSTMRGAIAAAIFKIAPADRRDAILEDLFGNHNPVNFGVGRVGRGSLPAPITLVETRFGRSGRDLALQLMSEELGGEAVLDPIRGRPARGTWRWDGSEWCQVHMNHRRVIRAPRNIFDGRAEPEQSYALNVIDPFEIEPKGKSTALQFWLPARGRAEQLRHIVEAANQGLFVGASRSRGVGRMKLVGVEQCELPSLRKRHSAWGEALQAQGVPWNEAAATGSLLALGFVAIDQGRLEWSLQGMGLKLLTSVAQRQRIGGWNSRANLPRTSRGGYSAGSVFLVATQDGSSAEPALAEIESNGVGPGRADGWGHFVACHPIHIECSSQVPR